MSTDAQRAAVLRHQAKLDRIVIQPEKEEGAIIRQAASNAKAYRGTETAD